MSVWCNLYPPIGYLLACRIVQLTQMTRMKISQARDEFPELVNRAVHDKERTIVSKRGKEVAAVIPIEDLRLLERLTREKMDRIDVEASDAALKEAKEKRTVPLEEARRRLGL